MPKENIMIEDSVNERVFFSDLRETRKHNEIEYHITAFEFSLAFIINSVCIREKSVSNCIQFAEN